jgi:hypothetical protein
MEMAWIECFECKKSISSTAHTCIHCGAPLAAEPATTSRATPISFGQLPRDAHVPEVSFAPAEPAPKVEPTPEIPPAPVSRHRRRGVVAANTPAAATWPRPVEGWLKVMVFLLPPFFVWFLLRPGHSLQQRLIGFGWLGLMILASSITKP